MLKRLYSTLLACSLIGSLFISSSCSSAQQIEAKAETAKVINVAVVKATRDDLSRDLVLAAEFRPYQEIDVHAKVAGYLKEIFVDVGDRVKKGQLLATLEIPETAEELRQAEAIEKRSEAEVTRMQAELHRGISAHTEAHLAYSRLGEVLDSRPNLIAQQEMDVALARDRAAEAQISAAQAALAAAQEEVGVSRASKEKIKTMMEYSRITATFPGVITKRFADPGAMIQAGTASQSQARPVVRLSQNDRLRLVFPVPESVAPQIQIGAPVEVKVPALGRTFEGTVSRFVGKVETSTRTMETEVDVPNPQLLLLPGMYAFATLTLERKEKALVVPIQAVSVGGNQATVLRVNGENQIEERAVKLGIESPTTVEILSGLEENDRVVIGNRSQLKAGQIVEPRILESGGM
ncbi:MAG: efflux RND transporter periplasmic adaptor subunit [Acidobacteria bacterium]|nr:efflux RND transporter periplasmic adaptor subunit [Acidobacteriota bacterium]